MVKPLSVLLRKERLQFQHEVLHTLEPASSKALQWNLINSNPFAKFKRPNITKAGCGLLQ